MPTPKFAFPVDEIPDFTNENTQEIIVQLGEFKYDYPQYGDSDTISLGAYQLINGSFYLGSWKHGKIYNC